eukprot:707787-Rhodomonas_salina.1
MDSADEIVRKNLKLDSFLMKKKLIKLQALCVKGHLCKHGSKLVLEDRLRDCQWKGSGAHWISICTSTSATAKLLERRQRNLLAS